MDGTHIPGSGARHWYGRLPFPLAAQCALLAALLVAALLVPPADGPMLLVPLAPRTLADLIDQATSHGARLVGPGPLTNSVVVIGRRAAVWRPMLAAGTLVIAASPRLCGDPRTGIDRQTV